MFHSLDLFRGVPCDPMFTVSSSRRFFWLGCGGHLQDNWSRYNTSKLVIVLCFVHVRFQKIKVDQKMNKINLLLTVNKAEDFNSGATQLLLLFISNIN